MYSVVKPNSDEQLNLYYKFRWQNLREPWGFPEGSEKDEYEGVSEHRIIQDSKGNILAIGRVHLNTSEEAQIRHIAVSNTHRKKGLGFIMLSALEQVAKELGAKRAITNPRDGTIDFFESCGFVIINEATDELGKIKRKQMVKELHDQNALILHPRWCKELQDTWHERIPISEHMGITLYKYTERTIETRASLNKNVNVHGTMFAGSIYSLATLTGWGMIFLQLKQKQLEGEIVLGDADIHYHKPVTMKPRGVCNIESLKGKFDSLTKSKKCPINLSVEIYDNDSPVASFHGRYWVLPHKQ